MAEEKVVLKQELVEQEVVIDENNEGKPILKQELNQEAINPELSFDAETDLPESDEEIDNKFPFINKDNVYQVSAVLIQLIKTKPENIKYACLVISSVDVDLAEMIISEFNIEMQAKIMNEMLTLIQLSHKEVESFSKMLPKLINEQFGGRQVLSKILENLKVEEKEKLINIVEKRYPDRAFEFRQILVLFEDLFKFDEQAFGRLFGDIPAEVLSTAFARESSENISRLKDCLSKGMLAMVEQGIEGAKIRSSLSEITKAQQYIIDQAKQGVENGFLPPIVTMKKAQK